MKRGFFLRHVLTIFSLLGVLFASPRIVEATFDKNAPNSCIDCHKTLEDARLSRPVESWSQSVHAEVGNTCDGCHGGNPEIPDEEAMSEKNNFHAAPKENEIVVFCGKCHQELSDRFKLSEHGKTETQNCIGCHGAHTIRRISLDIINEEKCAECHDYEKPLEMRKVLESLHGHFNQSRDKVATIFGFPTGPVKKDLDGIWKGLRQVRMISHTFDLPLIRGEAKKVEDMLLAVDSEIGRLASLGRERKNWGYFFAAIFSLLALAVYFYNMYSRRG
jgi:hypothetical protein